MREKPIRFDAPVNESDKLRGTMPPKEIMDFNQQSFDDWFAKKQKILFNLKRMWKMPDGTVVDLYKEIKEGRKTIEYRDNKPFWVSRLVNPEIRCVVLLATPANIFDLTKYLKCTRAWFVVGYPKGSLPRLEADITKLELDLNTNQFWIHFTNVVEVTA